METILATPYRVDEQSEFFVRCRSCNYPGESRPDGELAIMAWNDWNVLELFKRVEALEDTECGGSCWCDKCTVNGMVRRSADVDSGCDEHGMVKRSVVAEQEETYTHKQAAWVAEHKLSVGDKVKVTRAAKDFEGGWLCVWDTNMTVCIGETLEIRAFEDGYGVELRHGKYGYPCLYPYFVLEVVE